MRILFLLFNLIFCIINFKAQSFLIDGNDTINRMSGSDSLKQGIWREYFGTGNLKNETWYQDGKKDGLDLTWYNIPHCLRSEVNYKSGKQNGIANFYSRWCNIERSESYTEDKKSGEQKIYYSNGTVKVSGLYKEGELKGQYSHYDKEGKLAFESKSLTSDADLSDSSVKSVQFTETFILSKYEDLSEVLIVVDVTGSMYGVCGKILKWLDGYFLKHTHALSFVFFNDGDKKPDPFKRAGTVGGIYCISSDNWSDIRKAMQNAIKGGGGGDAKENDCEAIIKGLEKFPRTRRIILIADNTAPVRDMILLKKIKKPADILLCNIKPADPVLEDYVRLAHHTAGTIGSLENTFYKFTSSGFAGVINLNGFNYYINEGRVVLME